MLSYRFADVINRIETNSLQNIYREMKVVVARTGKVPLSEGCLDEEQLTALATGELKLDVTDYVHVEGCCNCIAYAMNVHLTMVEGIEQEGVTHAAYLKIREARRKEVKEMPPVPPIQEDARRILDQYKEKSKPPEPKDYVM